jgi:hypothetical protein
MVGVIRRLWRRYIRFSAQGACTVYILVAFPDVACILIGRHRHHHCRDNGAHRARSYWPRYSVTLSKRGPSELRRLLFLAALFAAKTKAWHPLYERYREKGLSSTAVLVILARRIARTAWSMYTYKTEFDPARLTKGLT